MTGARMRIATTVYALVALLGMAGVAAAGPIPLNEVRGAATVSHAKSLPSDEGTWTATMRRKTVARAEPSASGRVVARLDRRGANSRRHTVMATGAYRDARGTEWVRVQLISRPNESTGWVHARDVAVRRSALRIEVHLTSQRLVLLHGDAPIRAFPAGIGRGATPTPTGTFAVWDVWRTPAEQRGVYGSHVIALNAHSRVLDSFMGGEARIGIHGGGSIGRVGRPSSNGCVILAPDALAYVAKHVGGGTEVTITDD